MGREEGGAHQFWKGLYWTGSVLINKNDAWYTLDTKEMHENMQLDLWLSELFLLEFTLNAIRLNWAMATCETICIPA